MPAKKKKRDDSMPSLSMLRLGKDLGLVRLTSNLLGVEFTLGREVLAVVKAFILNRADGSVEVFAEDGAVHSLTMLLSFTGDAARGSLNIGIEMNGSGDILWWDDARIELEERMEGA